MNKLSVSAFTLTSALGAGLAAHDLRTATSGLRQNDFVPLMLSETNPESATFDPSQHALTTWIGRVAEVETVNLPEALVAYDCRNNRLAWLALQQDDFAAAVRDRCAQYGAGRVAVVLGTSTSGILQTELAYQVVAEQNFVELPGWFDYDRTHETDSCSRFVAEALGCTGLNFVISTACSSSAKVFASAERLLAAGLCDAVVVGGVDSLCQTTLYGFNALQLVSSDICRPGDARRNGLSIGEAAGFALVELAASASNSEVGFSVIGVGESADAYHMSSPHPEGQGAALAMQRALHAAKLTPGDIGYINLHGTATPANDAAEDQAVTAVFGTDIPVSSTKGWTGHTLGAAGIVEIGLTMLAMQTQWQPQSLHCDQLDPALQANILQQNQTQVYQYALSNSFGFGGSNCSVIMQYEGFS